MRERREAANEPQVIDVRTPARPPPLGGGLSAFDAGSIRGDSPIAAAVQQAAPPQSSISAAAAIAARGGSGGGGLRGGRPISHSAGSKK